MYVKSLFALAFLGKKNVRTRSYEIITIFAAFHPNIWDLDAVCAGKNWELHIIE